MEAVIETHSQPKMLGPAAFQGGGPAILLGPSPFCSQPFLFLSSHIPSFFLSPFPSRREVAQVPVGGLRAPSASFAGSAAEFWSQKHFSYILSLGKMCGSNNFDSFCEDQNVQRRDCSDYIMCENLDTAAGWIASCARMSKARDMFDQQLSAVRPS